MAKFTFTSVEDGVTVTHSFEALLLSEIQERFNSFIEGSGFVLPDEEDTFEFRVTNEDFVAKEEDWLWDEADTFINKETDVYWNEAFAAKFGTFEANDVINSTGGADVISFKDYTLGGK
jgi:hypothetical protein